MREIKFRGKRLDNGEWVIGSLLQSEIDVNELNVKCQIHTKFADDFSIRAFDVDPKTVGEFTGLNDSADKEIYDGDILMYVGTNQSSMEAKFEKGRFVGEGPFNTHPLLDYFEAGDFQSIEVIGNIYEQ